VEGVASSALYCDLEQVTLIHFSPEPELSQLKGWTIMADRSLILKSIHAVASIQTNPTPDESLFDSGLLDSFTLVDLASQLEANFGIKIPDSDLTPRKFDTIERIDAYISAGVK
jgi:acyl carrier protein